MRKQIYSQRTLHNAMTITTNRKKLWKLPLFVFRSSDTRLLANPCDTLWRSVAQGLDHHLQLICRFKNSYWIGRVIPIPQANILCSLDKPAYAMFLLCFKTGAFLRALRYTSLSPAKKIIDNLNLLTRSHEPQIIVITMLDNENIVSVQTWICQ